MEEEKYIEGQTDEPGSPDEINIQPRQKGFWGGVLSALAVVFEFVKTTLTIIILAGIIRLFIIQPFIVDGQSMEPNFHDKNYLITEKVSYKIAAPVRGDVIIFNPPDAPNVNYIKRVIGLPGETVEVKNNDVYINGSKLIEPYLVTGTRNQTFDGKPLRRVLKDSEYFVMGDNRGHSRDSREIGPVPKENIISKTWLILYPFDNLSIVKHYKFVESGLQSQ